MQLFQVTIGAKKIVKIIIIGEKVQKNVFHFLAKLHLAKQVNIETQNMDFTSIYNQVAGKFQRCKNKAKIVLLLVLVQMPHLSSERKAQI